MNSRTPGFPDFVTDTSSASHGDIPEGTSVVWALQVIPSTSSIENDNILPYTHLLIDNLNGDTDGRCLLPVLPVQRSTPLHMIMGPEKRGLNNQTSIMRAVPPREIEDVAYTNNKSIVSKQYDPNIASISQPDREREINTLTTVSKSESEREDYGIKENDGDKLPRKRSVNNTKNEYTHIEDSRVTPRAIASLPAALQRCRGVVMAKKALPARARFGPVRGIRRVISKSEAQKLSALATEENRPIYLIKNDGGDTVTHIDVGDEDKSNWFHLLPLGAPAANVWLYAARGELFALAVRPLAPRAPLALGYGADYARAHALPEAAPAADIALELSLSRREWWCEECGRALASPALLQRHIDTQHQESRPKSRRRQHRCRECPRVFSRDFCLKRHMRVHRQKEEAAIVETKNNSSESLDDVKLPSDESFQNILDFSTSLMDPDRSLPNLDISSSSKSASPQRSEYNTSGSLLNDDNRVANEFGAAALSGQAVEEQWCDSEKPPSCAHCGDEIPDNDMRRHISSCPARRLECVCGRVFRNKDRLAAHIHSQHAPVAQHVVATQQQTDSVTNDVKVKNSNAPQDEESIYSCEDCKITFKRRGMLVNHLWRVHPEQPLRAAAVPLVRRARLYLCSACPKLYRTAAKRDRHVAAHHPGAGAGAGAGGDARRVLEVRGAARALRPAACGACPRQYASRAKLLQHVRTKHPHLAPPPKSSKTQQASSENIDSYLSVQHLVKDQSLYTNLT